MRFASLLVYTPYTRDPKGLGRIPRAVIDKAHPWLEVVGFAAVRTMSFEVVTEPLAPIKGSVTLGQGGWGSRVP